MNQLEQLTADIREKLPRLKELNKECLIETAEKKFEIDDLMYAVCDNGQIYDRFRNAWIFSDEYTILGKEPMLNDVLEWLSTKSDSIDNYGLDSTGNFLWFNTKLNKFSTNPTIKWDLSKPNLKDQSPELITFLHGLIKK